jgi:hypothetical protein
MKADSKPRSFNGDLHNLPAALAPLMTQQRWVLWRWARAKSKWTKVPYQLNGAKAKNNDPTTWSSYDDVLKVVSRWDGIGYCLQGGDVGAFDIDNCRDPESGTIDPWAMALVERAASYVEITVSGTGLRVIGRATGPHVHNKFQVNDTVSCEIYRRSTRYIVVTGNGLPSVPQSLADIDAIVDTVVVELETQRNTHKQTNHNKNHEADEAPLPRALLARLHIRNEGEAKPHAGYPTRSGLMFGFLLEALHARIGANVIVAACLDEHYRGNAIREHCRENGDRAYVVRQIEKARAKLQDDIDAAVKEINEDYAMVLAGNKAAVMKFEGNEFRLIQVAAFIQWFANQQIVAGKKVMSKADYWSNHPKRRQYEGIEFEPGKEGRRGYYNLWRGYSVEPKSGGCSLFLAHLKDNVAQGDAYLFHWVVAWFAHIFQHPSAKIGNSLALRGKQGAGKTIVGQIIGSLIKDHYRLVADPRYVTGQFNAHMVSLLLLQADEAFWAGDKRALGKLKDLITGEMHPIEYKGIDPIWVKNHIRLLATSNEDFVVPAGFDERRFAMLDIGDTHAQDHGYFAAIIEQMNKGGREALLHHLLHVDLSAVDLRTIPKTTALVEQIIEAMTTEQAWWFDTLKSGLLPWGTNKGNTCSVRKLFDRYIRHAQRQGARRRAIETKIGMFLHKYVGSDLRGDQRTHYAVMDKRGDIFHEYGRFYEFPPLSKCRERFARMMNQDIVWDNPDDNWRNAECDEDDDNWRDAERDQDDDNIM